MTEILNDFLHLTQENFRIGLKFVQIIFELFPIHYTLNDPTIWLSVIPDTEPYYFINPD
jgi:hypothetical protein